MTATQTNKLKNDAMTTIAEINPDKMTKEQYMLLGASMGALAYMDKPVANMSIPTMMQPQAKPQGFSLDYVIAKIHGELEGSQNWVDDYTATKKREMIQFAWDESNHGAWLIQLAQEMGADVSKEIKILQKLQDTISKL